MNQLLQLIIITFFILFKPNTGTAQSFTTVSKSCGACGKPVSIKATIGQKCPHCGVIWGRENTATSTSTYSRTNSSIGPSALIRNPYTTNSTINQSSNDRIREESKATKSETINWILGKLRKHSIKLEHDIGNRLGTDVYQSNFDKDYQYDFVDDYLIIKFTNFQHLEIINRNTGYIDLSGISVPKEPERKSNDTSKSKIVRIPIAEIERFSDGYNSFSFYTEKSVIELIEGGQSSFIKSFDIGLKCDAESELGSRVEKAFNHLKKLAKKPTNKESF